VRREPDHDQGTFPVPQENAIIAQDEKPEKRIILQKHPASPLNAPEGIQGNVSRFAKGENTSL